MIDFLQPKSDVEELPADPQSALYVRSYLTMRLWIGVIGVALPLALVFGDGLVFDEHPFPRDSLSAYYYSGTRDLFVGGLLATAIFLITYEDFRAGPRQYVEHRGRPGHNRHRTMSDEAPDARRRAHAAAGKVR